MKRRVRKAGLVLGGALMVSAPAAWAQDLPKVQGTRRVVVEGIVADARSDDVLGVGRTKFHGLIASELSSVGYAIADVNQQARARERAAPPLHLVGILREEVCDDQSPRQCRVAVQWELRDSKGVVAYRTLTRAVDQSSARDDQMRALVQNAVRSLLQKPRFALQLTDATEAPRSIDEPLGFKQCSRPETPLPNGARSAAAAYVLVESGSRVAGGTILSPDGLILTEASVLAPEAPLFVRLAGQQKLPAELLASEQRSDVALIRVNGHFEASCLPLRPTAVEAGMSLFGVSSPLSEERAASFAGSFVQGVRLRGGVGLLRTDPRIAQAEGAPLLDASGRLAAVVSGMLLRTTDGREPQGVDVQSALTALRIKPAAITDPRLMNAGATSEQAALHYVRDPDDPPFVLTQRYTYGTSSTARSLRRASLWTAGVGMVGVVTTWVSFRASSDLSSSSHGRLVLLNDLSWGLTALGAVGFGISYALPEAHETVAVHQSGSRAGLRLALGPSGVVLSGRL